MKELSIEEKAKRYDEAIEKAKTLYENANGMILKKWVERVFPELKESEDEKIIKAIISYIDYEGQRGGEWFGVKVNDIIAWLEKQGEQIDLANKEYWRRYREGKQEILDKYSELEKQGEQNPADNQFTPEQADVLDKHIDKFLEQKLADKVEPKFEIGEWVIYDHRVYQVVELPKEGYINLGLRRNEKIEFAPSTYCRPWTIQDAKDGDVLATENFIFIFKNIDNGNGVHYYCHYEIRKHEDDSQFGVALPQSLMGRVGNSVLHYSPATKEQRDLLFSKMKEAGYEWDADKKELKKISQEYPLTPDECIKPAWSEEDENMFENTIGLIEVLDRETKGAYITKKYIKYLKSLKERVQPKQEWSEEDKEQLDRALYMMEQLDMTKSWDDVYNWLKSLKERYTWKPSDEQVGALNDVISSRDIKYDVLSELWKDLKKLKEEYYGKEFL